MSALNSSRSRAALPRRRRRLRLVPQLELTDCGAACLAMVVQYHFGVPIAVERARDATGTTRNGVSAAGLVRGAAEFGLRSLAVRPHDSAKARELPRGSTLHWRGSP